MATIARSGFCLNSLSVPSRGHQGCASCGAGCGCKGSRCAPCVRTVLTKLSVLGSWLSTWPCTCSNILLLIETSNLYSGRLIMARATFSTVCAILPFSDTVQFVREISSMAWILARARRTVVRPSAAALPSRPSYQFPYGADYQALPSLWEPLPGEPSLNGWNSCRRRIA